jgi:hypothetical protein
MSMVSRGLETRMGEIRHRMRGVVQLVGALWLLSLATAALGQASATTSSQGSALIQWSFGLTGGGPVSKVIIQHCSAGAACVPPDPTLYHGNVSLTNCDTSICPDSVVDTGLTASTTYVDVIEMFPTASNTTGQVTVVWTAPYTTSDFAVPSITSFQAMTGSTGLLTTNEADAYYSTINVYGCLGAGCTNFTLLEFLFDGMDSNTGFPVPAETQTNFVGGLTPSTTYTLYVTASDGINTSAPSPTFTMETPPPDTTPPTTQTNLTAAVISPTEIDLSYGASTDNLYLEGYSVQSCAGAGCTNFTDSCDALAPALTCNATSLTSSTTYQFVVFAVDGSGNQSPNSNIVTATTLPAAPNTLTASDTASMQVTLSWTPVGNPAGLAGYLIEQCQGAGCTTFSQVAQASGPSAQVTGLTPLTTYQFRVRSVDLSGNDSGYSNIVTVNTLPIAAPTALTAAVLSDSQVTLSWTASPAPGISAYLIERCADSIHGQYPVHGRGTVTAVYVPVPCARAGCVGELE